MPKNASTQVQKTVEKEGVDDTALADFEWDETGSSDFFGVEGTAVKEEKEEIVAEEKEDTTVGKKETKEEDLVEEAGEDEAFFGVKETKKGVVEVEEEVETEESYYNEAFVKMKEGGIFQNAEDLPEGEELTQEKFIELQDNEIESRVDEAFEGFFSELDSDAAAFLKHKKEGGSTENFFKVYSKSVGTPTGDLDDEVYQEKLARHYYKRVDGEDSEDIDDKIEWLKESGKLEKYAQKFDTKLKEQDEKAKEDLKKQAIADTKASDDSKKAFANSVQEALDNIEEVDNFKFTPKSKKKLLPFITKPTVKVGKNRYITGMQSKLQTALKNPERMLILAQLLENDFDISGILTDANTVNVKKLKKDIQRQRTTVKPGGSGKVGKRRSLADIDF